MYAWEGGPALVQTVDFFTPIVDDPYIYGQIAAANSLSDVYAMGGRPLTALAIAAFPQDGLHTDDIAQIFRGGFDKLREAGVALLGGHTVQDREIKFGYAVTGAVDPKRILTNAGAKPGDRLILTKPLGTGIVGTAIKFGRASADLIDRAVAQMRTLNKAAAEAIANVDGVHACTDITGFGLAGHASEMAAGSNVTIEIDVNALPIIPGVLEIASQNQVRGDGHEPRTLLARDRVSRRRARRPPGPRFRSPDVGGLADFGQRRSRPIGLWKTYRKAGIQAVFVGVSRSQGLASC